MFRPFSPWGEGRDGAKDITLAHTRGIDMTYDESKAVEEIRGLSLDARSHLQHVWRNGLQVIAAGTETGESNVVTEEVYKISNELRRLGI